MATYKPNSIDPATMGQLGNQGKVSSDSGLSNLAITSGDNFASVKNKLQGSAANYRAEIKRTEGQNIYGVQRKPWVFATFDDVTAAGKLSATGSLPSTSIIWTANPKSVSWQINQRGTESKNKSGTVLHIWRDRLRKTDFDDPKLTFQFNAGNILPTATDSVNASSSNIPNQVSDGLKNFYQFLSLVDSPKISSSGQANVIHILYRSRIFPGIVLTGFFDPQVVVQFQDDSNNPNTITGWQATFTVYSTTPKLNNFAELIAMFKSDGFDGFQSK